MRIPRKHVYLQKSKNYFVTSIKLGFRECFADGHYLIGFIPIGRNKARLSVIIKIECLPRGQIVHHCTMTLLSIAILRLIADYIVFVVVVILYWNTENIFF